VDEVCQGMGCVVYLYLTEFWQAGGGANGRRVTGSGLVGAQQVVEGGRYISASAGGIIVVYSADVSFSFKHSVRYKYTTHPILSYFIHLPMKLELTEGSETSAIRTQTPENYPKQNILQNNKPFLHIIVIQSLWN